MASPINVARSLDAAFEASPAPKMASPHATSSPLPPAAGLATAASAAAVPSAAAAAKRKRAEAKQREAWAGVAAVGECVVDMEREIAATLRQQRKLATVARRTLSECEDRSRWLQSVADAVSIEQRLMATMRTELERDIALTQRREDATRQAAAGHRHIPADGFSALAAEEEAADARLAALEREAEALKRVMERLTEREAASKAALEKLDAREAALRTGHRALDTARRENAVSELHLEDRERAATRHDAEIARWSTSLDAREAELMRRSRHLEECFGTLGRAERSLGLAAQPTNVGFTKAAGAGAHHVSIDRDDFTSTSSDDE